MFCLDNNHSINHVNDLDDHGNNGEDDDDDDNGSFWSDFNAAHKLAMMTIMMITTMMMTMTRMMMTMTRMMMMMMMMTMPIVASGLIVMQPACLQ